MYLPVFLWTVKCQKRQVHPFWELVKLISKYDLHSTSLVRDSIETNETPCIKCGKMIVNCDFDTHFDKCNGEILMTPCILCGNEFPDDSLDEHIEICNK